MKNKIYLFAIWICAALGSFAAHAQDFPLPTKPIKIIVPYPSGGPTDAQARVLAKELSSAMSAVVIVDNRPGAGGAIGAAEVSRAPADGYTLLYTVDGLVTQTPHVMKSFPIDALKGLTPIARAAKGSFALLARPGLPAQSMSAFATYAKANPRKLTYASAGIGTGSHIYGEVLNQVAGIDLVHVPYKGSAAALLDLLGGRVDIMFDSPMTAMNYARDGRLMLLAAAAPQRFSQFPDVPTLGEVGLKGLDQGSWLGLFGPENLDPKAHAKLQQGVGKVTRSTVWKETVQAMALEAIPEEPANAFAAAVKSENERWQRYIIKANIQTD
ncbi:MULTISPECIES: Bug family tripartite tricarboxylate transporter substrate binding protein [unclassified Variovorax]|uniref:Bug family tripartite tricarboxylate transporter substrate binding protein n=1 Tax=unclassified Variovorax TaxID=663243 RepID=UPI003F46DEED